MTFLTTVFKIVLAFQVAASLPSHVFICELGAAVLVGSQVLLVSFASWLCSVLEDTTWDWWTAAMATQLTQEHVGRYPYSDPKIMFEWLCLPPCLIFTPIKARTTLLLKDVSWDFSSCSWAQIHCRWVSEVLLVRIFYSLFWKGLKIGGRKTGVVTSCP